MVIPHMTEMLIILLFHSPFLLWSNSPHPQFLPLSDHQNLYLLLQQSKHPQYQQFPTMPDKHVKIILLEPLICIKIFDVRSPLLVGGKIESTL